jgi:hypothetical protein
VASKRQIGANQTNAQKSTGPRSKAGKEASSRNALRHGLAISIGSDPAFRDDIEKLAIALSGSEKTQNLYGIAREAAEATLELSRIRKLRTSLFEKLHATGPLDPDRLAELNTNLAKLERYERRAFSRRKHALRSM